MGGPATDHANSENPKEKKESEGEKVSDKSKAEDFDSEEEDKRPPGEGNYEIS
jgi:hypothetical protein